MNLHKYEIKEYNFMNILRNTATLIIAKHLNIIFKFYISSNIYTSKSAEEIGYFKKNFGHDLHQGLRIYMLNLH